MNTSIIFVTGGGFVCVGVRVVRILRILSRSKFQEYNRFIKYSCHAAHSIPITYSPHAKKIVPLTNPSSGPPLYSVLLSSTSLDPTHK